MSVDYLYSGDINSSLETRSYSEIKSNSQTSPILIQNCIEQIYRESFEYIGFDFFKIDHTRGLPGYLYQLTKIVGAHATVYYSPEVESLIKMLKK